MDANWIEEHSETIDRISSRMWSRYGCGVPGMDLQDFQQEVRIAVLISDRFDPSQGSPATWVYWTARAVFRTSERRRGEFPLAAEDLAARDASLDIEDRTMARGLSMEVRIDIDRAFAVATPAQVAALLHVANGGVIPRGASAADRGGLPSRQAIQKNLRQLRSRLAATA